MANISRDTFQSSIDSALQLFPGIHNLKYEQRECIEQLIVEKRDVLAILPTGFGKSIIYQLIPRINEERSTVIVVSPLESIREQQKRKLEKVGMLVVDLSEDDALSKIPDAEIVFGSAEQWISSRGKNVLRSYVQNPVALVIDEAHTTETWYGNFNCTIKASGILVLALSVSRYALGTVPRATQRGRELD